MLSYLMQDWQRIQLMHVFQEQLVTGSRSVKYDLKGQTNREAMVNLQNISIFEEHFYLVILERRTAVVHMWKIVIASQGWPILRFTPFKVLTVWMYLALGIVNKMAHYKLKKSWNSFVFTQFLTAWEGPL